MRLRGWALTGWIAFGLLLMAALLLYLEGWNEDGVRMVVRATARTSVTLFLLAFTATALRARWPSPFTRWLRSNRRYVGVGFAVSHYLHLAGLITLGLYFPDPFLAEDVDVVTLVGGGLAYAFITAMTLTSFNTTAAWLGAKRWKLLHTVGGYYIWIIFAQSYFFRALENPNYIPLSLAVFAALALRLLHLRRKQQAPEGAARPSVQTASLPGVP